MPQSRTFSPSKPSSWLNQIGVRFPLIQAPMAGVSTPQLAAAVSNAGGLGSLGIGASTVEQARTMIEQTRALTAQPFNVNLFCHAPAQRDAEREAAWLRHLSPLFAEVGLTPPTQLTEIYPSFVGHSELLELLLTLKPAVVSFHFGLPSQEQIQRLRAAGIATLATATSVQEARLIEQAGVEAVIAQGIEAGGHRGCFEPDHHDDQLTTAVLTRLLVKNTSLPVIAAGGIMDGQGIRAMLDLGAVAAQLGSAFLLCPESAANAGYRQMLKSGRAATTRLTRCLSGRPARGIVNRFIEQGEGRLDGQAPTDKSPVLPADYPVAYDAAKRIISAAAKQGNHELAAHWVGQGAPLIREMSAEALVATLMAESGDGR